MSSRAPDDTKLQAEVVGLRAQLAELRTRLREPEEIIRAIRQGEVDAVVVNDRRGERVYSLRSADVLYRGMVEEMKEGAVALDASGLVRRARSSIRVVGNKRSAGQIDKVCHADHAHVDSESSATCFASSRSSCGGGATSIWSSSAPGSCCRRMKDTGPRRSRVPSAGRRALCESGRLDSRAPLRWRC